MTSSGTLSAADLALLRADLESDDRDCRMAAIKRLEQAGDEPSLEALRARLRLVSQEQQSLILAIGILRWRLANESADGETWRLHDA
jgi:hypothetical protein